MSPTGPGRPRIGWGAVLTVRLGAEDVGRRVSVRATSADDPTRTVDTVGVLLAWEPDHLVIERRDGTRRKVQRDALVAGRVVAPEIAAAELHQRCLADPAARLAPPERDGVYETVEGSADDLSAAARGWEPTFVVDVLTAATGDLVLGTHDDNRPSDPPRPIDLASHDGGFQARVLDPHGVVVGQARAGIADRWASLSHVHVAADQRRRGLGRSLVAALADAVAMAGAHQVWVEAAADDSTARAFLDAVGFRPHHRCVYRRPA